MTTVITNEQDLVKIPDHWEANINKVVELCLAEEGVDPKAEVSLLFVDNEAIREINKEYREKDTATDVLSFPMYEADEEIDDEEEILFGDIIISLERALEQSKDYGHSVDREVRYLLVHGLLHLAGYELMDDEERKEIRQREEHLLEIIGEIRKR